MVFIVCPSQARSLNKDSASGNYRYHVRKKKKIKVGSGTPVYG